MLYENLQEQLQECLPEYQRQFVIQNYQKFLDASKEKDPVYQQFVQLIDKFQSASSQIEVISKDIENLKNAKARCKQLLEEQVIKVEDVVEDVQAEDQLTEMLDNLSMFTFEKNYEQAIESYKLLIETHQSKKFMKLIKKPEIKRQLDEAFKSLCQSIFNDYISQNAQFDSSQLMQYLMVLNQVEMLIKGYLQIQQDKFVNWIEQQNQFNEKQVQQFVGNILKVNQQYESIFGEYLRKNQLLFSFISIWNQQIIQSYFDKIQEYFFQDVVSFDDIFSKSKTLLNTFSQYQSKGISIDFEIQKELAIYIENKVNELFGVYGQKINQYMHFNESKLVKIEFLPNLLESDKLLESKEMEMSNKPQEIKLKASATIKSTFDSLSQGVSISSCFFWNIVFKLGDSALNFFNPEQYSLLSTMLNESISKLLILFIKDYLSAIRTNRKEGQLLFEIGNLFGNYNLNSTLINYLSTRASNLPIQTNSEWKRTIQDWVDELKQLIQQHFKNTYLQMLPFWICEHGKIYIQKQLVVQKPSPLFLMIGFSIMEMNNQFKSRIPQAPTLYYLGLLWDYTKYLLEYSLYWSYHNQGKNNEVFLLDAKSRNELKLDMNQINLQFQQSSIKIQQISQDGLKQLILDTQFVFDLFNRFIGQLQQNDQFLPKLVSFYCKDKKCQQPQMNSQSFEQYFSQSFQQDMIQAKNYIEQQRKSIVT
ncbi:unnamed protein product [Paramecium octaurelia]|uniref:Uncharacterized protein n=1 Tax=Paramecium octaurelia TaxID=43137 RepID=A0A8S1U5E9_PAROT|nr:unnamed protein product [Paramecium octaurelia]